MSDVFTKAKRSEVMSRIRSRSSESLEVEVVAADAEVFDNVGDEAAGHVAGMPSKCDKPVGAEGRVKGFAPRGGEHRTSNIEHPTSNRRQKDESSRRVKKLKPFWELRILRRELRDGASDFEQSFQMRLGSLLESKGGLATVAPVRVAAGQQNRFGNPDAVFILTELHFREWNDHDGHKITRFALDVKEAMFPRRSRPRLNLSTFNLQPSTS
jgi:hypothetical protein